MANLKVQDALDAIEALKEEVNKKIEDIEKRLGAETSDETVKPAESRAAIALKAVEKLREDVGEHVKIYNTHIRQQHRSKK